MSAFRFLLSLLSISLLVTCNDDENADSLILQHAFIGATEIPLNGSVMDQIPRDGSISLIFSDLLNESTIDDAILLMDGNDHFPVNTTLSNGNTLIIRPLGLLKSNTLYTIVISNSLAGQKGQSFESMEIPFKTIIGDLNIAEVHLNGIDISEQSQVKYVKTDFELTLHFNHPIAESSVDNALELRGINAPSLSFQLTDNNQELLITGQNNLSFLRAYDFEITDQLVGASGEPFSGYNLSFVTQLDSTFKYPEISDGELLTKIQQQTFKYFWDFGHPVSGLARERNTSGETVTSGGSGFGLMAIIVGIEREFITRAEGIARLDMIISFLKDDADRFHGAWSHWLNGTTGQVIPFSSKDDGGDLVETAFMIQGLLTVRQYLDNNDPTEASIISDINTLWQEVEWDWYTQGGQNVLYWHWSPNFEWEKNHKIQGWNEALIIYVLAASSPTHTISKTVYEEGWARNGNMINSNSNQYYGFNLPLRSDRGGPLFFAHYSFLGLDPRNLSDQYADYWTQNVSHSMINHAYCEANPKDYWGYSDHCWGLTASDNQDGYSAHSPDNDLGVIAPTAAISSIAYTPEESMNAIRHFYYILGDQLWGEYGFYDAFNLTVNWTASSYLAIDQGPIITMIENYRTGLLWDLFMSAPEVQTGLQKLDFTYE